MLWRDLTVGPGLQIMGVIEQIDSKGQKLAMVVSEDGRLLGTVSDGDIRRAILRGISLQEPVARIMNASPITMGPQVSRRQAVELMQETRISLIPVVDEGGYVLGVELLSDYDMGRQENLVVLMAGGQGLRLRPLTEKLPKPLLPLGGRPILEHVLRRLIGQGFSRFLFSINYLGDLIRKHFGDGSSFGVSIEYLEETRPLGTAGALGLIRNRPTAPFLVINGDLLTELRFDWLIEYHRTHDAVATMAVREYDFQVPFGVVQIANNFIASIEEKPVHRMFINAGIYVVEPLALEQIKYEAVLDMPTLLQNLWEKGHNVAAFPLREPWIDIGRVEDLQRAEFQVTRPVFPKEAGG